MDPRSLSDFGRPGCAFAILNAMWYEVHATGEAHRQRADFELPDDLT